MILTPDQQIVHDAIIRFVKNPDATHITVGGWAGTGKTTVTAATIRTLRGMGFNSIAFCCFTGKASSVLRQKLMAAGALANSYCGTIHSLIYHAFPDGRGGFRFERVPRILEQLVVVDEASMVNEDIWLDLLSYKVPIVAIGDHGQLPPISRPDTEPFNLMGAPQFRLEKIHRQAEDNPIIKLATQARLEGRVNSGSAGYGIGCWYLKNEQIIERCVKFGTLRSTLFLCALNRSRQIVNKAVRNALAYTSERPQRGEKVICLKNNREAHIYNGVTGIVERCEEYSDLFYDMTVRMDDGVNFSGVVLKDQFGAPETIREHPRIRSKEMKNVNLFDFGYCLTVHKAQGSEAENVVLFMERMGKTTDEDWKRWLYTGITRARKFLTIVNRLYTPKPKPDRQVAASTN